MAGKAGISRPLPLHVASWLLLQGRWTSYLEAQGPGMSVLRGPGTNCKAPYALARKAPECHICSFLLTNKATKSSSDSRGRERPHLSMSGMSKTSGAILRPQTLSNDLGERPVLCHGISQIPYPIMGGKWEKKTPTTPLCVH